MILKNLGKKLNFREESTFEFIFSDAKKKHEDFLYGYFFRLNRTVHQAWFSFTQYSVPAE